MTSQAWYGMLPKGNIGGASSGTGAKRLQRGFVHLRQPIRNGEPRRLAVNVNVHVRAQARIVIEATRRNFNQGRT